MAMREEFNVGYGEPDNGMSEFQEAMMMPYGKERRAKVLESLSKKKFMFLVNCKYRPQMKEDTDLKRLIKQKKVKLCNVGNGGAYSRRCIKQFIRGAYE